MVHVCLSLQFGTGHNFPFSGKDMSSPWYFVKNSIQATTWALL